MVRLRGHHLICLHFFRGEGYTDEFISNLLKVLERVEMEDIDVIFEADDVCRACPYLREDICCYAEDSEARIAKLDRLAIELLKLPLDLKISWGEVKERIQVVLPEWRKHACAKCDWQRVCKVEP
jgi:hypothetical protein